MNMQKRRRILKSFVTSQFRYCPLIQILHSRCPNNKINSIHERSLRITYQDHISTFQELSNKDNSVSIRHRNLQALATDTFKVHRDLSPDTLREIFVPKMTCIIFVGITFLKEVKFTLFTTALNRNPFQVEIGIQCHWNLNNWKALKYSN